MSHDMSVEVTILWGSQSLVFDADPNKSVRCAMEDLERKTGVPVARQKLMMRRRQLLPDDPWPADLKPGARLMMIGTAEAPPAEVEVAFPNRIHFNQCSSSEEEEPRLIYTGLPDFGNTCYVTSIIQVFRHLPEVIDIVIAKSPMVLAEEVRDEEEEELDKWPVIIETPTKGHELLQLGNVQEELTTADIVEKVRSEIREDTPEETAETKTPEETPELKPKSNKFWSRELIAAKFSQFLHNDNNFRALRDMVRAIQRGFSQEVVKNSERIAQNDVAEVWRFLVDCLAENLDPEIADLFNISFRVTGTCGSDSIVKDEIHGILRCPINSEVNRLEQGIEIGLSKGGAESNLKSEITKLPKFLMVQLMRFDFRQDVGKVVKILRKVETPKRINVINWLSNDLKAEIREKRETEDGKSKGYYELKGIIAHKGRTPEYGHYVTFMHMGKRWLRFDEDMAEDVEDEDSLLSLASGDGLCAYMVLYVAEGESLEY